MPAPPPTSPLPAPPAHDLTDALELLRHSLVGGDDFIEGIGDLALDAEMVAGHSHREIAASHRLQRLQQFLRRVGRSVGVRFDLAATAG